MSNSDSTTSPQMINVQINGTWQQFPKGTRVIEACKKSGHFVPHYCYHPALSSPGNCRMCLIEMGTPKMGPDRQPELGEDGRPLIRWNPKPAISCAIEVSEGLAIKTDSPLVQDCRKGVMEFLLINHPLDCPICDKAGECRLQEFSVEYGDGGSRFDEEKEKKPKHVDIGERIVLDDERCILCSRCIRFMQEVAHDDVLGFVERGGHTTLTVHPGKRLDSNYSLNTVDICPVGALTSKDFRFKMRVWFLKETKTIDTSCGTGCNITINSRENQIYRIMPRQNDAVNSHWIPDSHRLNFHYIHREDRLVAPQISTKEGRVNISWQEALDEAGSQLAKNTAKVAILASGRMTNEELFLTKKLAKQLQTPIIDIRTRPQEADGILISDDANPNTRGAQLLEVTGSEPGSQFLRLQEAILSGAITGLITLHENPLNYGLSEEALQQLETLLCIDILPHSGMVHASMILPGSAAAEKRGSMINVKGRLQRLNRAITAPGEAKDDWEIVAALLQRVILHQSEQQKALNEIPNSLEKTFQAMAEATPALAGLNLGKIGDLGVILSL